MSGGIPPWHAGQLDLCKTTGKMLDKGRNTIYNYNLRYIIAQMGRKNSKETDCDEWGG
jgi:hypothetical protein